MAKLLVFDRDNIHPDPVKDREGAYKTGDVVYVAEDSHEYSAKEQQAPFRVVTLPGPASDYQYLRNGEPRTPKDDSPKSMIRITRLMRALLTGDKYSPGQSRRRRWHKIESDDTTITQKPVGRD